MIKSNLNVKLAENNLKISKVYNDTGISRSTLTTLATGDPKGIQLDTIDTLCRYLNITQKHVYLSRNFMYILIILYEFIGIIINSVILYDNVCYSLPFSFITI